MNHRWTKEARSLVGTLHTSCSRCNAEPDDCSCGDRNDALTLVARAILSSWPATQAFVLMTDAGLDAQCDALAIESDWAVLPSGAYVFGALQKLVDREVLLVEDAPRNHKRVRPGPRLAALEEMAQ